MSPTAPAATTLPWWSTAIREASVSASSSEWVVSRTEPPAAAKSRTCDQIARRDSDVEPGRRLVEQHRPRRAGEGERKRESTPLAAREPSGLPVAERPREPEALDQLVAAARRA